MLVVIVPDEGTTRILGSEREGVGSHAPGEPVSAWREMREEREGVPMSL